MGRRYRGDFRCGPGCYRKILTRMRPAKTRLDQLASRRISVATGWDGQTAVGIATGRSPISSRVRTPVLLQNENELSLEFSRSAMATADRNGRLSSTSTAANT